MGWVDPRVGLGWVGSGMGRKFVCLVGWVGSWVCNGRCAKSERDFSCVGHTITDTRSRLSAKKVELIRWGLREGLI